MKLLSDKEKEEVKQKVKAMNPTSDREIQVTYWTLHNKAVEEKKKRIAKSGDALKRTLLELQKTANVPVQEIVYRKLLERLNCRIRQNYKHGQYNFDYVIYDYKGSKFLIDFESILWHTPPSEMKYIRDRDNYFISHGWNVLRIKTEEVRDQTDQAVDNLINQIERITK